MVRVFLYSSYCLWITNIFAVFKGCIHDSHVHKTLRNFTLHFEVLFCLTFWTFQVAVFWIHREEGAGNKPVIGSGRRSEKLPQYGDLRMRKIHWQEKQLTLRRCGLSVTVGTKLLGERYSDDNSGGPGCPIPAGLSDTSQDCNLCACSLLTLRPPTSRVKAWLMWNIESRLVLFVGFLYVLKILKLDHLWLSYASFQF